MRVYFERNSCDRSIPYGLPTKLSGLTFTLVQTQSCRKQFGRRVQVAARAAIGDRIPASSRYNREPSRLRAATVRRAATGGPYARCCSGEPPRSRASQALALRLSAETRAIHGRAGLRQTGGRSRRSVRRLACILPVFPVSAG